jgi:hypothetical protein
VAFRWIKAHAGQRGNEPADQLANEAASNKNVDEYYNKFSKSKVMSELKEQSLKQWQHECSRTTKGAITKSYFPKTVDRIKLTINATPNFTTIMTGHGNIEMYLYKYKIIQNPMYPCKQGDQSVDHILFDCILHEQDKDKLKSVVKKPDSWPVSKDKLGIKYYKTFK